MSRHRWARRDQLGIAFQAGGVVAIARKFHQASEDPDIEGPKSPYSPEGTFPRTFKFAGKHVYPAICYDSFGIRHKDVPNRGMDVLLNHVHRFARKGERMSGSVDYARKGPALAARAWGVPIFAAVSFDGYIEPSWPTGIKWHTRRAPQRWRYSDNPLSPAAEFNIPHGDADARIQIFPFSAIWPS
jgi:hypothetical protein